MRRSCINDSRVSLVAFYLRTVVDNCLPFESPCVQMVVLYLAIMNPIGSSHNLVHVYTPEYGVGLLILVERCYIEGDYSIGNYICFLKLKHKMVLLSVLVVVR